MVTIARSSPFLASAKIDGCVAKRTHDLFLTPLPCATPSLARLPDRQSSIRQKREEQVQRRSVRSDGNQNAGSNRKPFRSAGTLPGYHACALPLAEPLPTVAPGRASGERNRQPPNVTAPPFHRLQVLRIQSPGWLAAQR